MVHAGAGDRRGSPRVRFSGVTVVLAGQTEIRCIADNVSESGMLIFPIALSPPAPGPFFRLTFTFPFTTDWVEIGATLARRTLVNRRPGWGVRFTEVPGNARALIRRLVEERCPPSADGVEADAARGADHDNAWLDEIEHDTAPLTAEELALLRRRSSENPA